MSSFFDFWAWNSFSTNGTSFQWTTLESTSKVHKYFSTDIKCPCACVRFPLFPLLENFQVSGALRFILNDKHVGCCVCRGRRIDTFTYLSADLSLLAICSGDWNYLLLKVAFIEWTLIHIYIPQTPHFVCSCKFLATF